mmetsp:Transcript_1047/g.2273  ORF Transcript_1047/g.2273 Transcript_1047/m.2273 type:complete len:253 (-) Transcript_1047:1612-2370(-)
MHSTRPLQMLRPRPLPPYSRWCEALSCEKGLNRLGMSSSLMPIPLSVTSNWREKEFSASGSAPGGPGGSRRTLSVATPSAGQNLTALLSKFDATWRIREGSLLANSGTSGATSSNTFTCLSEATRNILISSTIVVRSLVRWKGTCSKVSLPSCTLFKSRTSSTMQFITRACESRSSTFPALSSVSSDSMKLHRPKTAVSGLRSSWHTYCKNSPLARFPASSWRIFSICRSRWKVRRMLSRSEVCDWISWSFS